MKMPKLSPLKVLQSILKERNRTTNNVDCVHIAPLVLLTVISEIKDVIENHRIDTI